MHVTSLRNTLALVLLLACGTSSGQAWPERPITLIVPFPAGGGIDVIARPFAERMGELLGKPVVVVPRDGASGTIGMAAVAASKPDGYTLAFTASGPLTIQPHVIPTLPYRFEGLVPLCQVFASQYVIAVRGDSAYRTLADLIGAARSQPGKLTYGFGGVATSPHLAMAQLVNGAKLDMLAVPFRGDPAAILALKAGDIDSATLNIGLAKAQGFRALATFAETRQREFPDTPTLLESGYRVASAAFGGLIGPKGMPDDVVRRIESTCQAISQDERYRNAVRQASQEPLYRNASDYARVLAEDFAIKRDVVKQAGITAP